MYLRRKADEYLVNWKSNPDKKPLIVRGARQIGKTETILQFARNNYESVIEINFVKDQKYKMITADGYEVSDIIKNISRMDPAKKFIPHKTLLFFDEVTEFPDIATALKFFKLDGRFDVICSGSMLGTHYRKIEHNSVGYKTDYTMYSMDFEEFLWAKDYDESVVNDMLEHMKNLKPFNDLEMHLYHALFTDFCILGGMPAVVREYIEKNTFEGSVETQLQLIEDYKEDVRKYAEGLDQARILNMFQRVVPQLAMENKKLQISKVAKGARFHEYRGCAEWLADAGIVNICYCLDFPCLPLKGNYDADKFKLYFADTGLLVASLDEEAAEDLRTNKNLGVYKGALYENMVAEALVKSGYPLYYYKRSDSTLKQDFFIRSTDALIPIEVKAKTGRAKSLRTLIESARYPEIDYGFKFSFNNIGYRNKLYTFPYFCAFLLKRFMKTFSPAEDF